MLSLTDMNEKKKTHIFFPLKIAPQNPARGAGEKRWHFVEIKKKKTTTEQKWDAKLNADNNT